MIGWEGVVGYEARATVDGRAIQSGALRWTRLPVPLNQLRDVETAGSRLVGSIKTIDRHVLADGSVQLWGTGRYTGGDFIPGDHGGIGLDMRLDHTVELRDGTLGITRASLIGAHIGTEPAWPDARIVFVAMPRDEAETLRPG